MSKYVFKFYHKRIPNEIADRFYTYNWKEVEASNPKRIVGTALNKDGELIAAFELQLMEKINEVAYNFIIKKFEIVPELQHEGYGVGVLNDLCWKYRPKIVTAECIDPNEDGGESKEWFINQGFVEDNEIILRREF